MTQPAQPEPQPIASSNRSSLPGPDDSCDRPGCPWSRILKWVALGLILVVLSVGGMQVYQGVSVSIEAEHNLHATIYVIRLVEQFVSEKQRWPRTWQELEALPFPNTRPTPGNDELSVVRIGGQHGYEWPAASQELQQRVQIDFGIDPATVSTQDPETFTAIQPIGPSYEYRHYGFVHSLQDTIRQATQNTLRSPAE
ncbi:MAG: hypothetical protein JSS02_02850 [Planctomycetes bacterium]|nr:hypothetical protein [Planctomycetota bacterium]